MTNVLHSYIIESYSILIRGTNMKFLLGLDFRTILYLLLAVLVVFGIFKRLFKLVIFIVVLGVLFYLFNFLM